VKIVQPLNIELNCRTDDPASFIAHCILLRSKGDGSYEVRTVMQVKVWLCLSTML
jgi:hypothetical protein